MLDFVACRPPSEGDGSEKCEYLIDRFKAEVESSHVLIGAFEICDVFRRKAHSIPSEVRTFSVVLKPFSF